MERCTRDNRVVCRQRHTGALPTHASPLHSDSRMPPIHGTATGGKTCTTPGEILEPIKSRHKPVTQLKKDLTQVIRHRITVNVEADTESNIYEDFDAISLIVPACPAVSLHVPQLPFMTRDHNEHPEPLMTEQEVAQLLKRSVKTLRNDRSAGRGPKWLKLGRSIRYRPADVIEWLHDKTGGGGTAVALVAGLLGYN